MSCLEARSIWKGHLAVFVVYERAQFCAFVVVGSSGLDVR